MSDAGVQFLRAWEGVKARAYPDAAGRTTIGVGHLLTVSELRAKAVRIGGEWAPYGSGLTSQQIDSLLRQDLADFEGEVGRIFAANKLKQHEFDALVAVAFNIGEAAFAGATFVARIRAGNRDAGLEAWGWWNKVTVTDHGKRVREVCDGLRRRRDAEIKLFRTGDYSSRP